MYGSDDSADSEKELMEVAVQHAVQAHGHKDTPEFRHMLKKVTLRTASAFHEMSSPLRRRDFRGAGRS